MFYTLRRIVIPLLIPWNHFRMILMATMLVGELSLSVVLSRPGTEVLAVQISALLKTDYGAGSHAGNPDDFYLHDLGQLSLSGRGQVHEGAKLGGRVQERAELREEDTSRGTLLVNFLDGPILAPASGIHATASGMCQPKADTFSQP